MYKPGERVVFDMGYEDGLRVGVIDRITLARTWDEVVVVCDKEKCEFTMGMGDILGVLLIRNANDN